MLERGSLYVEHQRRADVGYPSPLIICEPQELLRYQEAEDWLTLHRELGEPMSYIVFDEGGSSIGEIYSMQNYDGSPWWSAVRGPLLRMPIWRIPLWFIAVVLTAPWGLILLCRLLRSIRTRRMRGFAVAPA